MICVRLNFRHNKKMEDDLVKQHKNNTKINKSSEKQKQNEPKETENIVMNFITRKKGIFKFYIISHL